MSGGALLACVTWVAVSAPLRGVWNGGAVFKASPFPLSAVTLPSTSRLAVQRDANTNWLLGLDVDRLTCLYTAAANLTCSTSGWPYKCIPSAERPACDPYPHEAYFG